MIRCGRAGLMPLAMLLTGLPAAMAAGPSYVPDRTAVRPYEAPPPPEDLDRLEMRELDARVAAIKARVDRVETLWAARQRGKQGGEAPK
jgi:uncharacterized small protein (DUF1192 family)